MLDGLLLVMEMERLTNYTLHHHLVIGLTVNAVELNV